MKFFFVGITTLVMSVLLADPVGPVALPKEIPSEVIRDEDTTPEPLIVEVVVPEQVDLFKTVYIDVKTNARHSRVRVRRTLFDQVTVDKHAKAGRYGFTGPSGEYLVEVDVIDDNLGWEGILRKVVIGTPEPSPPPPTPPPSTGFGLAAQVPGWLATVPQAAKSDIPAIKKAMQETAAAKWDSVADMQAGLGVKLGGVITKPGWGDFGSAMSAAMNSLVASGKIKTTAESGQALLEIAEAL